MALNVEISGGQSGLPRQPLSEHTRDAALISSRKVMRNARSILDGLSGTLLYVAPAYSCACMPEPR